MLPILRLSWLGSPAIEYDGRPLRLEMRKTIAFLAYLSLSPQSLSRETLATLFWPEFSQQHSLSNLRRNLFSLVKSLPPGLLEIDRERISLKRVDWLQMDVEDFLDQLSSVKKQSLPPGLICPECLFSLEKAVELYKGDFLEGFNLKDCPEFDEWQYLQRENLRTEYAGALERLAAYYRSQGEWEKAIRNARSWVALDPLNEPAQQMLIRLYNQSGQRSLALRQYETLIGLLKNELGQYPEAETQSLYQSLFSPEISGHAEVGMAHAHFTSREPEPLIKTKLFIPPLRGNRVARPRLLELLDVGSQRSLTLISAPAGFGKTTLLASWVAHTRLPIAWFSIDDADNDPARFIAYLIAALDSILSGVSEQFQPLTQSLMPSIQSIFARLINHLSVESDPFVLILDDYQFIHSQDIHKALTFLLEKIPACMHLVIGTRTDPPVSLARLRGRDQLVEIRMSDLRFSLEESDSFLRQVMSLHLTDEDISALEARTEGWIAGLQMAALAIRTVASQSNRKTSEADSRQTISKYIQVFSGSNRYILDYLCEEVLNHRPEKTRSFLLQTSILERFSGSLCDAVTGIKESQMILEELEKENLFLVPMDSERHWYRYHHLFAELLRFKLEEALFEGSGTGGEGLPSQEELHLRAADWFEKYMFFGEAIHHYVAARKFDQAAALIEAQAYPIIFTSGQAFTLMEWLAGLPADLFRSNPRLNIAKAWTLILLDQFTTVKELLETSWQILQERQVKDADRIIGEIALVRGTLAELTSRDVEGMRAQGLLAWEKLSQEDSMLRGMAAWLLGASYLFDGDIQHAEHYLTQAIQLCQGAGNIYITSVAVQELGIVRMEQGKYHEAYQLLQQTLKEMSSGGRQAHPSLGYLYRVVGLILFDWDQLEEAERAFTLSIDLVAQDIPGEMLIMSTSMLPYLKLAQGKREEALRLAENCIQRVEAYPFPYIPAIIKANLIRFWIRVGDRDRVEEWLHTCGLSPDDTIRCVHDAEYTAFAKALLWQGRAEEALKVLAQLHDLAHIQGRNGKLFYILALKALALQQSKNMDQALKVLETSLVLAQSEGYIRPYVEEGQPMEELLELGEARGIWQQTYLVGYVNRLLKAIHRSSARN